jgi:beta-glucosidase
MTDKLQFPADFIWGAATSAYQIEGSPLADGAGPSNWHRFCRVAGAVLNGDTGDVACDHYRRWADDVKLMRELGLKAYRFSIAWSRVLPSGRGRPNENGLDFYRHLTDALVANGIEPFVTLHHWDLPIALDDLGGWANRDAAHWFADYAHLMFRTLEDRVRYWTTLNEPWVIVDAGYMHGVHPPGLRSLEKAPVAAHNLLRGHGLAVQAFRADGTGRIGLVVNLEPKYAASNHPEDAAAMARAHAYMNRQFLDPVFLGAYPDELAEIFGRDWPRFSEDDLKLIQEPIDFLGINYYTRSVVRNDPTSLPLCASPVAQSDAEHTEMNWEVFPAGLKSCLLWVKRRYGDIPLYITENGAAFADPEPKEGRLEDPRRVDYFRTHLRAAHEALQQGVNLKGYFAWSLLDNFEWSCGFAKRFGLVHVDYATQKRTPKDSASFYRQVIESNGEVIWR